MLVTLRQFLTSNKILVILVTAGLLHGVLYFLIIPPWWHFDEPGHFEYAWLAANRPGWPAAGEYDEGMRLQMAKSMNRYGWYSFRNYYPDLSGKQPVWIGAIQTGDQPAYYFLISLPLRLLQHADITIQYNAARLISLLLYLLIIVLVWLAMGEIVPAGHPLQWIATAFAVLLPAFVDEMISVNNDVGAVLVSCLFLWISLQMVRRGLSPKRFILFTVSLALCYFTKSTAWYALAVAPPVLILAWLHGRRPWLIWSITAAVLIIGLLVTLEGGNPAFWYQGPTQDPSLRLKTSQATLGTYAFQIDYSTRRPVAQTGQFLSQQLVKTLRGKTLTLGLWAWSDSSLSASGPSVRFVTTSSQFNDQSYGPANLSDKPAFLHMTIEVPVDASYAILIPPSPIQIPTNARIFFDAVVLAQGSFGDSPPQFTNAQGSQGTWGGVAFHNLIRNGSAEQGNLRVRPWVNKFAAKLPFVGNASFIFSTLEDWQGTGWYYQAVLSGLLLNFWSYLAGGHLGLPGNYSDNFLGLITLLGLLGACMLLWRKRKSLPWDALYILGLSLALVWGAASARGVYSLLTSGPLYPWGRYAYPAILPTALLLSAGWLELSIQVGKRLKLMEDTVDFLPAAVMLGLALYTLVNIVAYFHPYLTNLGYLIILISLIYLAYLGLVWSARRMDLPSGK